MEKIWANRIIAGTKKLSDVPAFRLEGVKQEIQSRFDKGIITEEQYRRAMGLDEGEI